ncbi:MAG: FHA domain-containing protein [Desulfobacterales bacterium]|nr:FHA domain-containing protein [Desulfobacterales bacterium]
MNNLKSKLICLDDSSLPDDQKYLEIDLTDCEIIVGRGESCNIVLKSNSISRKHARIFPAQNKWCIEDLNSSNGISINNKKIKNAVLVHGDIINFATIPFRYEIIVPENIEFKNNQDIEKTFLISEPGAIEAILDAAKKSKNQTSTKKDTVKTSKANNLNQSKVKDKPSKSKYKFIFFIILLLGLSVAIFIFYNTIYKVQKEKERFIEKYQKELKEFTEKYENYPKTFDIIANVSNISEINKLLKKIRSAYLKYEQDIILQSIEATLIFMRLEREVHYCIAHKKAGDAIKLVKDSENNLKKFTSVDAIKELANMLKLMEIVVLYKIFEEKYPYPDINNINNELKDEIIKYEKTLKDEFIELKKKNYSILMIKYPYFNEIIKDVDDRSLILVHKWADLLSYSNK